MYLFWLYYLCLGIVLLIGLGITVMTLPGLWVMLAAALVYAALTHGYFIGAWTLVVLLVLAGIAEIIEFTSSGKGAKRAGGGRAGLWGALIGGVVGGIVLSVALAFIPILNALIGVCVGTFLGATVGEYAAGKRLGHSAWVGFSAARGRLFGTIIKLGFGCLMLVVTMGLGLPLKARMGTRSLGVAPHRAATGPATATARP